MKYRALVVLSVAMLAGCASKLDPALTAQNLKNVQLIAADNADLAAKAKLDDVSSKVYADNAAAAVKLAKSLDDGAVK
jgi:outer membrane murein-binding lipoprotein Lpp